MTIMKDAKAIRAHQADFDRQYARRLDNSNGLRFPLLEVQNHKDFQKSLPSYQNYIAYMYRRFSAHILANMELEDGLDILCVGCGMGNDEKNIQNLFPDCRLWSTDISKEMITRAIAGGSPSRFSISLAEALPFPDKSFDRVLSREVIEHVMNPAQMIREIARVLKPGGVAVVTTENERSLALPNEIIQNGRRKYSQMIGSPLPPHDLGYKDEPPTPDELCAMANDAGLEISGLVFDGALYHTLKSISQRFPRLNYAALAHRLSSLENSSRSHLYCDQYKVVLHKPAGPGWCNDPSYCCPGTGRVLEKRNGVLADPVSGMEYQVRNGVPDFVGGQEVEEQVVEQTTPFPRRTDGILRRLGVELDRFFVRNYPVVFLAFGYIASFFQPGNGQRMSRQLGEHPEYGKYIALGVRK